MRFDFYQLERDGAERVVPMLAAKALAAGARVNIACRDGGERGRLSDALWHHAPDSFLANGEAGGGQDARQPILLSPEPSAANGATMLLIADGERREAVQPFARLFHLFRPEAAPAARDWWKALAGTERRYWAQGADGRWAERG